MIAVERLIGFINMCKKPGKYKIVSNYFTFVFDRKKDYIVIGRKLQKRWTR